ncbi:FecCD family ABC transporter permease [Marinobacterium stanieri]|uniref:Iron complex transport system permease protein n=1 Tax=Marinobacterium stanieri TaxID=49186 RepID=A0A1N6RQN9_9GAMM|nr:iron ABC transporter permease [Marinobacterium stanieri]SIQ31198.1 iron complex transport system permease protein [Marinobacterium stanieri]
MKFKIAAGVLAIALMLLLSLMLGAQVLMPLDLWQILLGQGDRVQIIVLWELRLPRTLIALLVGAALATAGGVMQGVTRNPLAAPDLTGVVAGSACMVVILSTLFSMDAGWYPLAGISGGLLIGGLTFALAWKNGLMPIRVVLAGVAMSSVCVAVMTGLLVFSGAEAGELFFWLAGGLSGRGWQQLNSVLWWAIAPLLLVLLLSRHYRLLLLDDAIGRSLGANVSAWRLGFMVLAVVMTAATVIVAGPVGFVGLVVPHITRRFLSAQSLFWLPMNALLGALLLLAADVLARMPPVVQEIPLGVMTALLGGPWLLSLIRSGMGRSV